MENRVPEWSSDSMSSFTTKWDLLDTSRERLFMTTALFLTNLRFSASWNIATLLFYSEEISPFQSSPMQSLGYQMKSIIQGKNKYESKLLWFIITYLMILYSVWDNISPPLFSGLNLKKQFKLPVY